MQNLRNNLDEESQQIEMEIIDQAKLSPFK